MRGWLIGACYVLGAAAILIVPLFTAGLVALNEGDVARDDISAPRTINFASEILTQQDRTEAERRVATRHAAATARRHSTAAKKRPWRRMDHPFPRRF